MALRGAHLLLFVGLTTVGTVSAQASGFQIGDGGVRWRLDCDMTGPDIATKAGPGEQCGNYCLSNSACYVFTWTNYNGGTCWMKGNNWAFQTGLQGAVCGYVPGRVADNDGRLPSGDGGGGAGGGVAVTNIKTTYWAEQSDAGGCQMPGTVSYQVTDALALGQDPALGNLVWRSGLCGQVLTIDCGNGAIDAVVASTCNINSPTCGIDLIGKTWRRATNNQSPGIVRCSVKLSNRNPISGGSPLCFHRPYSEVGNQYSRIVGVLNAGGRISSSAEIAGVKGTRGNDGWFQFDSAGRPIFTDDATVNFRFEDGSTASFQLRNCASGGSTYIFK